MVHFIERALRRERAILLSSLIAITLLAWGYVLSLAFRSPNPLLDSAPALAQMAMPNLQPWQASDFLFTLLMWAAMMVAMMTPSAAPMILTFANLNRRQRPSETPLSATPAFFLGYLVVWISFSVVATLLQWAFHSAGLLSAGTMRVTPLIAGALLTLAGAYQFTPLKNVCLSNCRTPLSFLATEWRDGTKGAFIIGLRHGAYCLGCCWHLMLILFATGVMNLIFVALIAGYILLEKAFPAGKWLSHAIGLLTGGWGIWLVIQTLRM